MENEVIVRTNITIYDVLTNAARNSLDYFTKVHKEPLGLSVCAVFSVIGATSYIFFKLQDKKKHNKVNHINSLSKERKFQKYSGQESKFDKFSYHKILTEFHNACNNCSNIYSSVKCIELTSNYPELINIKLTSDGVTPFHRVCFHGHETLIEFMLAKGADPEVKTIAGENALCMALYYYLYTEAKNFSCLNFLYRQGCHLNHDNEWYEIFLNLAIKNNNKALTKWLLGHSKTSKEKSFIRASSAPL